MDTFDKINVMKKLLLIFAAIVLYSCIGTQSKKDDALTQLTTATTNAKNSSLVETECFLGFEFGMTEQQVSNHIRKLSREKTIYAKYGHYQYDFTTDAGLVVNLSFSAEYFEGKLYKMSYPCRMQLGSNGAHVFLFNAFCSGRGLRDGFRTYINTQYGRTIPCLIHFLQQ